MLYKPVFCFYPCLRFFHTNFIGGEIVSTFDSPELVKLGSCDLIEEVMVGEDRLLRFSGVPIGMRYS